MIKQTIARKVALRGTRFLAARLFDSVVSGCCLGPGYVDSNTMCACAN